MVSVEDIGFAARLNGSEKGTIVDLVRDGFIDQDGFSLRFPVGNVRDARKYKSFLNGEMLDITIQLEPYQNEGKTSYLAYLVIKPAERVR